MRLTLLIATALAAVPCFGAVDLCIINGAKLNLPTLSALQSELRILVPGGKVRLDASSCDFTALLLDVTSEHSDVLARTRLKGGRIAASTELFVPVIHDILGETRSPKLLGRALARVIAHEIGHFLNQSGTHQTVGAMQTHFGIRDLTSGDSVPYMLRGASRTGSD